MGLFDSFKRKQAPTAVLSHADYNRIINGTEVEGMSITHVPIGDLRVPTGRIVVCDPLVLPDSPALTRTVPAGTYPVVLHYVDAGDAGQRVAIAVLTFSSVKAASFELALRPGEDVAKLVNGNDFFGFPVDAGLGGFMDAAVSKHYVDWLDKFHAENPNGNIYDDHFAAEFAKSAAPGMRDGDWINYHFPDRPDLNLMMFSSGYGDGVYPAYWGVDEAGNTVSLVIDFHVALLPDE